MKYKEYDVVIIGSGAGGGTAADVLSDYVKDGLKVLLLEAGPARYKKDFNQNELDMSSIYFNRGAFLSADMGISVAAARTLGGSTAVYTGVSFRPPADVLEAWRNDFGLNFLTDKFIADTLDNIEKDISVHEMSEKEDNRNNRLFAEGCGRLGIPLKRLKINTKNCQGQGFCNLGCTVGAKQGTLEVQIPRAISKGVELITNATVTSVGNHYVEFKMSDVKSDGSSNSEEIHSIKARNIILAAGVLHTPAILLYSAAKYGWKNNNYGKYVTLHPAYNVNGIHTDIVDGFNGFPKTWYTDHFSNDEHYYLETSFYYPGVTAKNTPHFGKSHEIWMEKYRKMMSILILIHDKAESSNRITINARGKSILNYKLGDAGRKSMISALRKSAEIFFAAGCEEVSMPASAKPFIGRSESADLENLINIRYFDPAKSPLSSAHPQGGASMGIDPKVSCVHPDGFLHDDQSVYVADASLFPGSVKVNPYETIMLMATHVSMRVKNSL